MRELPKWPEDQGGLFRDQTPASHMLILVLWETWEVIDLSANRGYTDPPHCGLCVVGQETEILQAGKAEL